MTSQVCIDANIMVKWYVAEEHREQAVALARKCHHAGIEIIAPSFAIVEATSAVRRKVHRGVMSPSEGLLTVGLLLRAQVVPFEIRDLCMDAWRLAETYKRPTLYDAYYLALAELRDCEFWTADERLINSVAGLPFVKHIKDFVPGTLGT